MSQAVISTLHERLIDYGIDYLTDAEALSVLTDIPLQTIHSMIDQYNFHGLIRHIDLLEITQDQKTKLELVYSICNRIGKAQYQKGLVIKSPQDIGNLFMSELQFESVEVVILAFLDARNRLIRHEMLNWGTTNSAVVYKKDVARKALQWNAVGVIIGHNHPSGVATPSQDDINMTVELMKSLDSLDIKLLDHILIANNRFISFKVEGLF